MLHDMTDRVQLQPRTFDMLGPLRLDIGAESTRPYGGAVAVSLEEERGRLAPILSAVVALGIPVSIDTLKAKIAAFALDAGATIVNDVVNAGSAIRGTFADLQACGAQPVAIAALVVLGQSAAKFAADHKLALEKIASLPNEIWIPAECPLCARNIPLEDFLNTKAGVA